jgi:hypothetical protein
MQNTKRITKRFTKTDAQRKEDFEDTIYLIHLQIGASVFSANIRKTIDKIKSLIKEGLKGLEGCVEVDNLEVLEWLDKIEGLEGLEEDKLEVIEWLERLKVLNALEECIESCVKECVGVCISNCIGLDRIESILGLDRSIEKQCRNKTREESLWIVRNRIKLREDMEKYKEKAIEGCRGFIKKSILNNVQLDRTRTEGLGECIKECIDICREAYKDSCLQLDWDR